MKIKELIKQLGKIKDKEIYVGFGVWFGDENWAKGHKIFWDGGSRNVRIVEHKGLKVDVVGYGGSRNIRLVEHKGLKVAVLGYADNCLAYTFNELEAKTRKVIES